MIHSAGHGVNRRRADRMGERLARELKRAGHSGPNVGRVLDAYRLAMEPRLERLDEHDPAFLHPGRTAIVLLSDVGPLGADVLAAGALLESEEAGLRVGPARAAEIVGEGAASLVRSVPPSGDPRLAEALVTAPEGARLAALAERLDQLRHAHLWDEPDRLRRAHREAREVYLPVAVRTHPGLEARFRWWCEKFDGW